MSPKNKPHEQFERVVEAIKEYQGLSFDNYDGAKVTIPKPFSLSWLIPRDSGYYYYDNGTFPVPPCFRIPRVYIVKDPLKISQSQV